MPAMRYVGKNGEHFMGVPARNLSEDEFAALSEAQQANVSACDFYEAVVMPAPVKAAPFKPAPKPAAVVEAKAD